MPLVRRALIAALVAAAAPAEAAEVRAGTLRVNGRALRFREAGRRNAAPLLLAHLRPDPDLRGLAPRWRVVALDLAGDRGAGAEHAAALLRAADALALGRVSLLLDVSELPIAQELARRAPDRLDRVFVEADEAPPAFRGVGPVRRT